MSYECARIYLANGSIKYMNLPSWAPTSKQSEAVSWPADSTALRPFNFMGYRVIRVEYLTRAQANETPREDADWILPNQGL